MLDPNSQPLKYASAEVYEQIADASGNPSRKDRIGTGYINPQGEIDFDLKAGMYAVCPSENSGYGWMGRDCVYNVQVVDNNLTIVKLVGGQIEFGVVDVDGVPLNNVNVEAYTQKPDINGNPVTDARVWYGYLENTGTVNIWLTPGLYSISTDLKGYNWGSLSDKKGEVNFVVRKEEKTSYIIRMGRIVVGVTNPDGSPSTGIYVAIYTQKTDVNGSSVIADTLFSGSTDNGGFVSLDLTQGSYAVKIGDNILYDVPVVWGKTTQTDGKKYQQK
ncbi:MAG: hypothetical protein IPL71_20575 [Anaerolineales bacterium]|uniref:hypothetical protein n=1 Tax=Candidatus Villigracilis proximus TaxID=3140683 RepID=UPI003136F013|nr:hypothetical protein [Anaerolineales bacterium]